MVALGEMAIVMERLESLIVANSIFVAQCGLEGLTPANQVYWHAVRPEFTGNVVRPAPLERPFAIIKTSEFDYHEHSVGCMFPQMHIKLHLQDKYRGTTFQETAKNFTNYLGQFLDELSRQNMQAQSLVFRKITQMTDPQPVARRDENDDFKFWFAEYDLQIGADIEV